MENAARHAGKHLAGAVERRENKYPDSFSATYPLLILAMSTCSEVCSDVHALIKDLAIRRVEHRDTPQQIPASAGADENSTSLAAVFFCFTAGPLVPHASSSLQTGSGACANPTVLFVRPGACTRAMYRGGNRVREKEGSGRGRERGRKW